MTALTQSAAALDVQELRQDFPALHQTVHGKPLAEGRPKRDTTSMLHVEVPQASDDE